MRMGKTRASSREDFWGGGGGGELLERWGSFFFLFSFCSFRSCALRSLYLLVANLDDTWLHNGRLLDDGWTKLFSRAKTETVIFVLPAGMGNGKNMWFPQKLLYLVPFIWRKT